MTKLKFLSRPRFKMLLISGVIFLVLGGMVITHQTNEIPPVNPSEQQWQRVDVSPLIIRLGLVGHIESASSITFTAPFDGIIQELHAEEGQRIERGQKLLQFDTAQLDIQIREAMTELLKAKRAERDIANWSQSQDVGRARRSISALQMNLADSERKLAESTSLFTRGILPRIEVDALKQQVNTQRLDLAAANAELKVLLDKGSSEERQIAEMALTNATEKYNELCTLKTRSKLVTPFTGIVMRVPSSMSDRSLTQPVQLGTRVSNGQPLLNLVSLEQLKVVAKVQEVDINQLHEGQQVDITGDGFENLTLNGVVTSVGDQTTTSDAATDLGATYEVIVSIPKLSSEQQKRLKLGMSAKLSIITYQNNNAIIIPHDSIQKEGNQLFVEYRDKDGAPQKRTAIKVGRTTAEGVEVFGLKSGYVLKNNAA